MWRWAGHTASCPCLLGRGPLPAGLCLRSDLWAASDPNPKPPLLLPLSCCHWFHLKGRATKSHFLHLLHVKAAYQWNVTCESSAFPLLVGTCVVMLATLQPTDSEEKYEDIRHFILRLLRCKFNAYAFEVFTHRNFVFLVCACDSWKYRNIFFFFDVTFVL